MRDKDLTNKMQKLQKSTANERQRFSIRKLSVGAASVLLGTAFLFSAGQSVSADTTTPADAGQAKEEIVVKNNNASNTSAGNSGQKNNTVENNDNNGKTSLDVDAHVQTKEDRQNKNDEPSKTASNQEGKHASSASESTGHENTTSKNDIDKTTANNNSKKLGSKEAEIKSGDTNKGEKATLVVNIKNPAVTPDQVTASKVANQNNNQSMTFYGQISDRSKNPAGFNDTGINPTTGKKYPVQLSDLEHDFIFKRTIVMHNGDQVSTFVEGLDGKAYDPSTDTKSGMYYRNATVDADGNVKYSQWKRLGNGGIYEFASDLKFPEYKLNTEMQDASGSVVTSVAAADAEEAENSTINLYFHKVKIDVTYKDPDGNTITNLVSDPFKQLSDNTYEYEGSSAALLSDKDKIANGLLTLTSDKTGVFPQFSSLSIDGDSYKNQTSAKNALAYALSDYRNHDIQINVSYKYQLRLNLYDETSGKLITIPSTDANAKYFTTENGHSVYKFQVTPNTYVINLSKLYNYTMTDASWKTWQANFEKHSNGYWYTKANMDKPLTLTLNYRSNGTYSFIGTMRDTDGNLIPTDYTKSLGNMYKNGAYQYAQIKPGSYINDLTKFKLDNSHEYDYYLTADSLAQWEKYFEKHANGYWYAKDDLNANVALNLTYDKVQKRHINLTLVDADTGDAITDYAEKTTANGRGFDAHMDGNVYSDYGTKAGFAEFLLHMPGYEITADSKAKLDKFLAKPYVEEDFTGTLKYKKLAPIHVVAKDSDGNTLFKYDITTKNSQAGNPYEVNVLNIPGYKLVKDENNNGEVSTTAPTVTFTYEKDPNSKEGTWIKDYQILTPGRMLPDHVGEIGVPNGKYNVGFDNAQKENIKYYEEHGYTFLGAANAFKLGQQWYPLSWIKATLVPNQGVTVHYYGINDDKSETQLHDDDYLAENPNNPDQTNHGINESEFYYPEGKYTTNPRDFDGWTLIGIRDSKGKFTKLNYEGSNLVLASGINDAPIGQINGEYLPFAQDITYIYAHVPVKQTEEKKAKRTIHFVGDENKGKSVEDMPSLQNNQEQDVTIEGTYYTSPIDGKRVAIKTIQIDGKDVVVVDTIEPATETWTIKSHDGVDKNSQGKYVFKEVNDPKHISVDQTWSTNHDNVPTGDWVHTSGSAEEVTVKNDSDWQVIDGENGVKVLPDQYLVYKQKSHYNIHYVDVTGLDKTTFDPSDDTPERDLGHTVTGVGNDIDGHVYYVGDTPDATSKLWTSYGDEGYVLVQADKNLGKQTLTSDTPDQYVYLVKKAKHKTGEKTITRIVNFVTEGNHQVLLDPTSESVKFTQDYDYYLDKDGKEVVVTTKKLNGVDVVDKILTGDAAEAAKAWKSVNGNQAFTSVDKPEITNGKVSGDWIRVDATHDKNSKGNIEGPKLNGQVVPEDSLNDLANANDGADQVYTLYYSVSTPDVPDHGGNTPTTPTTPTQPTEPEQPTKPVEPTQPTTPSKPDKKTPTKHKKHYNENVNTKFENITGKKNYKVVNAKLNAEQVSDVKTNSNIKHASELPQTGEKNNHAVLIGALALTLGGLVTLFGAGNKRKD